MPRECTLDAGTNGYLCSPYLWPTFSTSWWTASPLNINKENPASFMTELRQHFQQIRSTQQRWYGEHKTFIFKYLAPPKYVRAMVFSRSSAAQKRLSCQNSRQAGNISTTGLKRPTYLRISQMIRNESFSPMTNDLNTTSSQLCRATNDTIEKIRKMGAFYRTISTSWLHHWGLAQLLLHVATRRSSWTIPPPPILLPSFYNPRPIFRVGISSMHPSFSSKCERGRPRDAHITHRSFQRVTNKN